MSLFLFLNTFRFYYVAGSEPLQTLIGLSRVLCFDSRQPAVATPTGSEFLLGSYILFPGCGLDVLMGPFNLTGQGGPLAGRGAVCRVEASMEAAV